LFDITTTVSFSFLSVSFKPFQSDHNYMGHRLTHEFPRHTIMGVRRVARQARSQKVWGTQYIFRGTIFLFYCMFKINYSVNIQRLTGQHIASCLFSV